MKNIHTLPTNKPSRLHLIEDTLTITSEYKNSVCDAEVNIYITSDEEIKDVRPHKGKWQLEKGLILNKFPDYLTDLSECKLIILTTDQDLINDGVQAIDDEFLEWFVKNPSCTEVEVEDYGNNFYNIRYLILIPQEEPKQTDEQGRVMTYWGGLAEPKQKTLEAAAKKYSGLAYDRNDYEEKYYNQIGCTKYDAFIDAVQWHQERSYSEEEVLELLRKAHFVEQNIEEWFEQFKKK